jgi:dTDP-4-amino-4,6-dideoxygalactose transaminase
MKESGIEILIPWGGKAIHQFKALGLSHFELPRTELLMERALMLPLTTELTDAQVEYVADVVSRYYQNS